MKPFLDSARLKQWFLETRRDLPWRHQPTPYAVWISEMMLQQTQVAVVIPYFLRWMERFPTIESLANASLDTVIKEWEGLGYYSRARYLHEGAKKIVSDFQGQLPNQEIQLKAIKGLGPYTIGAILSFAFHQKKAAVDGNVLRVLARYFQIEEDIAKPATVKRLRQLAEEVLPEEESWIVNEGLIELGATVCQRKPTCSLCPLQTTCLAYRHNVADQLPIKSKQTKTEYLYRTVIVLTASPDLYLICRRQKGEIMSDLHEFPYFETDSEGLTESELHEKIENHFGLAVQTKYFFPSVNQSFTRYQARLNPVWLHCAFPKPIQGADWISLSDLQQLAFSSGHRRIFQSAQKHVVFPVESD